MVSWPTWGELTELIKALAALAWPLVILLLLLVFRRTLMGLVSKRKLKRGKLLGQEFELEEELDRLEEVTRPLATPYATPSGPVVGTRELTGRVSEAVSGLSPAQEVSEVTRQVLMEAGSSPKAALMSLSAQIDADLRNAMQARGLPVERNKSWSDSVTFLRSQGFPKDLMDSLVRFRMIRNKIVHGYEADADDVFRTIDLGLRILNAINAERREETSQSPSSQPDNKRS